MEVSLREKAMAPQSSTLAWKILRMEEPNGLQSIGPQRVGHDLVTKQQQKIPFLDWKKATQTFMFI